MGYIRHFWTKEKGGEEVLDFKSKNGRFTGIEEEQNTYGRKILAWQPRNNGTRGIQLTGACLKSSYLPYLIQIRLKQHSKISFLKLISLPESLGQERGEGKGSCFLTNSLKSTSQIGSG